MNGSERQIEAAPTSPEPFITLRELAKRIGYSTRWIRQRVEAHGFPAWQIGPRGHYRFRWSEVEAWLARSRTTRRGGAHE